MSDLAHGILKGMNLLDLDRASLSVCLISMVLVAHGCCGGGNSDEPVDGWQMLREDLFKVTGPSGSYASSMDKRAHTCPLSRIEYCIQDDAFLKASVQPVLDRSSGGEMPKTRGEVRKLLGNMGYAYRKALKEPAAVEKIRGLIRQRFQNPVANKLRNGGVLIDSGFVPFDIQVDSNGRWAPGPVTDPVAWTTSDLAKRLRAGLDAHPQSKLIHLVAQFPARSTTRLRSLTGIAEHVLYRRGGLRIVRYNERRTKYIAKLPGGDLDALLTGQVSLEKNMMEKCYPRPPRGETPAVTCDP